MFRNLLSNRLRTNASVSRLLAVEELERRDMLTAGPRVVAVEVASTSWSPAFVNYLQANHLGTIGYAIPVGSSNQSDTLPWTNLDQISIQFDTDVVLNSADLSLSGVNHTAYAFSAFHYDPQTLWATWTLTTPLDTDRLQLDLDANGARPVRDFGANALDGEWTNNSSTVSGNGTAGGDFELRFNVQPADVNNSANVTTSDYDSIHQLNGESTTSSAYNPKLDIDGNGVIDASDEQLAVDRYFQTLPTGSPAGTNNDAPTTTTFGLYHIDDASGDVAIALAYGFADAENGSNGLTYSIQSNDNVGLFDTAAITQSTHKLIVNAASGVSGRATITVRATDAGGLFVDTPITIDVNRENQAPIITFFVSDNGGAGTHYFQGHVTDPDDNVADLTVYIYGDLFETRCAVDENGDFQFAMILDEDAWGYEYAVTYDLEGLESNTREDFIGLT